nr:glycoside hydrolase family 3 N-terminal domain-containing protein [Weissella diestrammenae]
MNVREKNAREQAQKLVAKMTLEEKVLQLGVVAPEIDRLNVPKYVYWSEALHGVARGGVATVFPQAIGLAAMFDKKMMSNIGEVISTEARAKYNAAQEFGDIDVYKGLTLWSPNVNIFRDPRWGRGHETFGEDPYLTASTAVPLIKAMQGDGKYLKTAACAKHFAVHSGPEDGRLMVNAIVNEKDLQETYLPAFEACVTEADVESVMTALNFVNGVPATLNEELFNILRQQWQFKGHITSDFLGLENLTMEQHYTKDQPEGIAAGVNMGVDLVNGVMVKALYQSLERGIITEDAITRAAVNLFTTRYKLGMFSSDCEFDHIDYEEVESLKNKKIAYDAALKSCVLLKNEQGLPLDKSAINKIAVIGPNANSRVALEGNYQGTASRYTTILEGIQDEVGSAVKIYYAQGCHLNKMKVEEVAREDDRLSEALKIATMSDVVILSLGLDATLEGENGDAGNAYGAGDKETLELPGLQQHLMDEILKLNKPTILLINAGSALTFNGAEENDNLKAIMMNWYPGAQGGTLLQIFYSEK